MSKVKTPSGYMVPAKYVAGLTGEERKLRLRQLDEMRRKGKVLGPLAGDKKKGEKVPESKHTKAYRRRYGKNK